MAGEKKAKKQMSKAREAALAKYKNAKSPQEKTVAEQELKLLRFKEVASHRVGRVLAALDNLMAATDAGQYSWDSNQAVKIISAISDKTKPLFASLEKPAKRKQGVTKFEL